MKIYYFSIYDILRARTNQIADIRLCEGFSQNDCDVELIVPYVYRKNNIAKEDVFDSYGIETPYAIRIIHTPFWDDMPALVAIPVLYLFTFFSMLRILAVNFRCLSEVVVMSRSIDLLIPGLLLKKLLRLREGPLIVTWAHEVIFKKRYLWAYRNSDAVVGTNSAITEDLAHKVGIEESRLAISLNPISEHHLRKMVGREEARKRLLLDVAQPLIVYTGKLYLGQKEAEYIFDAALQLPEYRFLLTGGKPHVIDHFQLSCEKRGIHNVTFTGFLDKYDDVRYYQAAADVLISYYSAHDHLVRYNLPNKICEYMLSGNPIVTCDFPATRDVLSTANAILVPAESTDGLVSGIIRAVEDRELAASLAKQAFHDVAEMTYKKRALVLRRFFESVTRRVQAS